LFTIDSDETEAHRLSQRHNTWRASFRELWDYAGLREGMRVLDLAPGPGDSSFELAERVGPNGLVVGIEYRNRFAQRVIETARQRELQNLMVLNIDLAAYTWPKGIADAIWGSWALLHVQNRPALIEGLHRALRPDGVILLQEYCDYGSWRLAPRSGAFDSYISRVINYWSEGGREIDAGISLPQLLRDASFEIEIVRPQVFAARPKDAIWSWSSLLARRYASFLAEHGAMARGDVENIENVLDTYEANDSSIMLTPSVFQIVARKRR
jgi:ubiquinone/menaquinone biosynthesis C-methylase UbiE